MAKNVCRILTNVEYVKQGKIDLKELPVGDLFRDTAFTCEDYEMFG